MSQKIPKNFACKVCDYNTCNKKDFTKHMATRKHKILTNTSKNSDLEISTIFPCICGKVYKHRQSLYNHKRKCEKNPLTENSKIDTLLEKVQTETEHINKITDKKLKNTEKLHSEKNEKKSEKKVKKMRKTKKSEKNEKKSENPENESLKKMFITMIEQNKELTNQIIKLAQKPTTVNHSNNTNFNLNVFLNETCKDAINIDEFVETLKVGLYELKYSMDNGIVDGVSNLLINGLGQMETTKRPIHCTDQENKTLYIKEDNTWERNNEKIVSKTINDVHKKYIAAIKHWEHANPNWNNDPKLVEQYVKIAKDTMTTLGIEKKELIIDKVSKEVELEENEPLTSINIEPIIEIESNSDVE